MAEARFFPEGTLINTAENTEATSSLRALRAAMDEGRILEGRVLLCDPDFSLILNLGGYRAVMEKEEIALTPDGEKCRDIAAITRVGKSVAFVILSIEDGVIRLSRKEAQRRCLAEYLDHLEIGDVLDARVTHLEPFGAFCDIGCGITSLISIDAISISRISHPSDRFYPGQSIHAAVRGRDEVRLGARGRICLTHKELLGTWEENADFFAIGQTVTGIVRSVENYGIFVELAPNLAGLSEYKEGFTPGETCAVYIKNILPEKRKIKLVLIDSHTLEQRRMPINYFITKGNVADFRY